ALRQRMLTAAPDGLSAGLEAGAEAADAALLLAASNPWWQDPDWNPATDGQGAAFRALSTLLLGAAPPSLVVIEGSRQTGKSQLLDALAGALLGGGAAARRVCRLPLEHGPMRWLAPELLVETWQTGDGCAAAADHGSAREFVLIDDAQLWSGAALDSMAQYAVEAGRVLVFAGLALADCVARWRAVGLRVAHCRLAPLDFAAFLAVRGITPALPARPQSLRALFEWPAADFPAAQTGLAALAAPFQDYLQRGGYPGAVHAPDVASAQRVLREQVVMRSLRWDAVTHHGVRRVDELEATLTLLAHAAGAPLDVPQLCARLTVERPTVRHFLELLEQLALLVRVPPLGYGERVQRARPLVYMADPALGAALWWQQAPPQTRQAESALLLHLLRAYGRRGRVRFLPLARQAGHVLLVTAGASALPFALHWGAQAADPRLLTALASACTREGIARAYLVTRDADEFGPLPAPRDSGVAVMRIPAPLLCLWLAAAAPAALDPG
ncbi:MAG: ATP-binding protein, partial [Pseudomonadota bacterium]|nr:ATP-binding protein [Pseudomonadota bacterium]